MRIDKAFEEYLKDIVIQEKQVYNNLADDC